MSYCFKIIDDKIGQSCLINLMGLLLHRARQLDCGCILKKNVIVWSCEIMNNVFLQQLLVKSLRLLIVQNYGGSCSIEKIWLNADASIQPFNNWISFSWSSFSCNSIITVFFNFKDFILFDTLKLDLILLLSWVISLNVCVEHITPHPLHFFK